MNKNLGLILNSEDFTDLLRQESNRADRTKRVFSVIIFHPVTENNDYTDLIKILKKEFVFMIVLDGSIMRILELFFQKCQKNM